MTDAERARVVHSWDITQTVYMSSRYADPLEVGFLERNGDFAGAAKMAMQYHRARCDRGVRDGRWAGVEDLPVPVEEAAAVPGAGEAFDLCYTFGLRTACSIQWNLAPGSMDRWTATWDVRSPDRWYLSRRLVGGDPPRPTAGWAADLLVDRPGGLDDEQLVRTLPFRRLLRAQVDKPLDRFAHEKLLAEFADIVRAVDGSRVV